MWRDGEGKPGCGREGAFLGHAEARRGIARETGSRARELVEETEAAEPDPKGQECGTIDARANGDTISSDDGERPSPLC
jgi:hypothetical protein